MMSKLLLVLLENGWITPMSRKQLNLFSPF
jgi:hypothetical protein